ncbi:MAG: homoserine kinase [Solirubrobacteraceae bacterium]
MTGVRIEVPASTANLGAGYDVLAAALGLQLTVEVKEAGYFRLLTDLHLRRDRQNLIVRAFERVLPADRYEFRVSSTIPLSGGMGSSAAGVVAGLLAADHFAARGADVLALATELEGHPDNVAASLLGGLVICQGADVRRLEMPAGLGAVLVIPHKPVRTALAREAVPASVPIADAVHNMARIAKLVAGLTTSDYDLIAAGLGDRLHQPYRAHLYPRSAEIVAQAAEHGALGATISGAGPTVLIWCRKGEAPGLIPWLERISQGWAEVLVVRFEPHGARVSPF